jgi:hypothetical protein
MCSFLPFGPFLSSGALVGVEWEAGVGASNVS